MLFPLPVLLLVRYRIKPTPSKMYISIPWSKYWFDFHIDKPTLVPKWMRLKMKIGPISKAKQTPAEELVICKRS